MTHGRPSNVCACGRGVIVEWRCSACGTAGGVHGLTVPEYRAALERYCRDVMAAQEAARAVSPEPAVPSVREAIVTVFVVPSLVLAACVGLAWLCGWRP